MGHFDYKPKHTPPIESTNAKAAIIYKKARFSRLG